MIPIIVIAGPTASGKTALSIDLAKRLGGEIVSADSMQIYRRMNIGTAKPTAAEMNGIPHHMIDIAEPTESFSVADYCEKAQICISDINRRNKIPIITGGTGLYIDSLINGVDFGETAADTAIRDELFALAEKEGAESVHKILQDIDPETAAKYHPNNLKRTIRAIEFYRVTGETISSHARAEKTSPYNYVYFCIDWERSILYDRINRRVDIMMADGLEIEVRTLLKSGCRRDSTAMQGIGYKEFFGYFDGDKTLSDVTEEIKMNSRRYAKRQLTWFRRHSDIHWLSPCSTLTDDALRITSESGVLLHS